MLKNWLVVGTVLLASSVTVSRGAFAQQHTDIGTTASPLTQSPNLALPPPNVGGADQGYLFNLRPLGETFGKTLADHGIYLTGRTFNEGFSNVAGGLKRGTLYEGFTTFGFDLDMNRIAGINGGSVHFLANDLNGIPFLPYSGSAYANNKVFGAPAGARLNEFSYEQTFFDRKLDLRVGRLPVGTEFDTSEIYCEFVTSLCATPSGYSFVKGYPTYLTASWGGVAQVQLPQHFYVNIGAYEDEPSLATVGHYNWPGPDWGFDRARGVTIPLQVGYRTSYKNDPYPVALDIGAFYDTGDYSDPLLNTANRNRALYGGSAKVDHGRSEIWLQAQKVIYRPDMTTERGITVFAAANFLTTGNTNISDAYFGGFSWRGPLASRPNDKLNFSAEYINLNPDYTSYVDSSFAARGINGALASGELTFEINYGLAIAPGVVLKPFFDYIVNPDRVNIAKPVNYDHRSVFVGGALSIFFPEALGLPKLGF